MTATPDTTIEDNDRVADVISTALEGHGTYDLIADMLVDLEPVLAAIRRHAAADALNEAARAGEKVAAFMRKQQNALATKGDQASADVYAVHADARYSAATTLRKTAADKLAEGYPFECAAFGQECETRVPDAGDFCARHEPEDDENRWAE